MGPAVCARCGRFCCTDCLQFTDQCVDCRARLAEGKASGLAIASAIIGCLSLTCLFLPGLIAIALGQWEISRINGGSAPAAGRAWARTGQALGAIALIIGASIGALIVFR